MLFSLILRNVSSRPTRSLLTILGISIGLAVIVTVVAGTRFPGNIPVSCYTA